MRKKFVTFALAVALLLSIGVVAYAAPCDYGVVEPSAARGGDPGGAGGEPARPFRPPPPG